MFSRNRRRAEMLVDRMRAVEELAEILRPMAIISGRPIADQME